MALRLSSRVMLGTHKISNTNDVAEKSGVVAITVLLEIIHFNSSSCSVPCHLLLILFLHYSSLFYLVILDSTVHSLLFGAISHRLFL